MATREYGQYSLVSYVHRLRGESLNLGVVVWHPRFGSRFLASDNLKRIACLDSRADLKRVERDLGAIRAILGDWPKHEGSPLVSLASQFRFDLVVSEPLNARVTDIDFLGERLFTTLVAPDRKKRKKRGETEFDKKFRKHFADFAKQSLIHLGLDIYGADFNYPERGGKAEVPIAARFRHEGRDVVWRTITFGSSLRYATKKEKAQAMDAQNNMLRMIPSYRAARLNVAVRVHRGDMDAEDETIRTWLGMHSDKIVTFDHSISLDTTDPGIILGD